jgi:maleylacetate reductase
MYAQDTNPITQLMAEQGIAALARALPAIAADPRSRTARSDALYGAWLCGVCLGTVGMALHHKLCHVLGGSFDMPHSETHTVVLPHAAAYNAAAAPDAMVRIARALGAEDAATGLHELVGAIGAPRSLAALGLPADALDRAADLAVRSPYWNPRPLDHGAIRELLDRAFSGAPPR